MCIASVFRIDQIQTYDFLNHPARPYAPPAVCAGGAEERDMFIIMFMGVVRGFAGFGWRPRCCMNSMNPLRADGRPMSGSVSVY